MYERGADMTCIEFIHIPFSELLDINYRSYVRHDDTSRENIWHIYLPDNIRWGQYTLSTICTIDNGFTKRMLPAGELIKDIANRRCCVSNPEALVWYLY